MTVSFQMLGNAALMERDEGCGSFVAKGRAGGGEVGRIDLRRARNFLGIDDLQVMDAALFQFLTHDPCKGADAGLGKVGDFEGGGIKLVSGAHGADDGNVPRGGLLNEVKLGAYCVDAVYDVIKSRKIKFI
jgi:hypothetical protein